MNAPVLFIALALTVPDPSLDCLPRFPRAAACREWVAFGRAYQRRLYETFLAMPPGPTCNLCWDYWRVVERRTDAWEKLLQAWEEGEPIPWRRRRLAELERLLTPEQFAVGFVPAPVDLRFVWVAD